MGISETLGSNGIFICDNCKSRIQLSLDDDQFEALKDEINSGEQTTHRCFLCSQIKHSEDGLYMPPGMMADAIEKSLDSQEKMYENYKQGKINCPDCGKQIEFTEKKVSCNCGLNINTKKYGKSLKVPMAKKITFKQYIKFLRGKSNVPGKSQIN